MLAAQAEIEGLPLVTRDPAFALFGDRTFWWIDRRALELLHDESIAEHGGAPGLRDEGLLESALAWRRAVPSSTATSVQLCCPSACFWR